VTETIQKLYSSILSKEHHKFRRELDLELATGFCAQGLKPIERVSRRLCAVLAAEKPVILEGERISMLRTTVTLPGLFTEEEWAGIKGSHFIHEAGYVCNIAPDYASTVALGLDARRSEAALRLEACRASGDAEGLLFLESMIVEIDAVLELVGRYEAEARRLGRDDIADTFARVPRFGARTFREALQSFRVLHFVLWLEGEYHNTVGRLDQYMLPYLEADLAAGRLDREAAFDLLEEFFLSFNRDSDLYTGVQQGDNGQSLVLGGFDAEGKECFNLLSEFCLRASRELKLIDPKINLRVGSATDPSVYDLGTELTREGLGFPQYSNDDVVVPGLVDLGYELEDARTYVVAACWEFIIPGKGMDIPNIGALSFPGVVDGCVRGALAGAPDFEAFLASVRDGIAAECRRMAGRLGDLWMIPAPFMSILMHGRIAAARDISLGARYNNYGFHGVGLSTAVDSLAAIRKYVFEEGSLSPSRLVAALDADFVGEEALLASLRYEAPKMGNGEAAVDELATRLLDWFADATAPLRNERGGRIRAGTGSAMFYLWSAREIGASADGRRRGEWFGANFSPSLFARIAGPLSVVKSFSAPHLRRVINGGPLTMEFHSTLFGDAESQGKVARLVRLFIDRGGHQLQLNAVNRDVLLEAQAHPERYGNLIVRVWGWSAYFVELDREYQEHVMRRQEYVG
jgi:pyruvate-formate lyase